MLTAIFEYGIILGMKRYQRTKKKPATIKDNTRLTVNNKTYPAVAFQKSEEQENSFDVDKIAKKIDKWTFIGLSLIHI